ncbi:MAG TPA: energy transducer TonB [Candidatus Sulfotelmatobacter sp.]|jgi:TonB family protein|nr:energy transducer TonB [Candidatus Sulfotelmatobacter sp.]
MRKFSRRDLSRLCVALVLALAAIILIPQLSSHAQDAIGSGRKVLIKTPAIYPTLARSMNIHGVVKVEAQVAPNGTVKNVEVRGGHPLLTQSAVTAVGHWKFEAASHETKELIEIRFDPQ